MRGGGEPAGASRLRRRAHAARPCLAGQQWDLGRLRAGEAGRRGALLVLDEVQKIPGWAGTVKRLWDEDTASAIPLKVLVLGSSPLLAQRGLVESLAGRFEMLVLPHWSFAEMQKAFGVSLEEYFFFGGYPGAAPLVREPERWGWEGSHEVDFVLHRGARVVPIEVKSGRLAGGLPGMAAFNAAFRTARTLLVGGGGIPLDEFLCTSPVEWLR